MLIDGAASGTTATTITVLGSIQSLGTAASPVTITADNASQAWGEIIHNNAAASLYQYTFISHAGNSPPLGHTDTGPAVYPINSTIDFEHSAITDNVGKIMYAQGSNLTFNDTVLARSIMGPEVTATAITVEDCFINEMRSPNDSDGIYLWNQQAGQTIAISDTVIAGVDDDCIDQLGASMTVSGCILRDSKDKGISQYNGEIWVTNTLAIDNARQPEDGSQAAFSMKGTDSATVKMHLDHVTIYNNSTGGIGIQCRNKYGVPVVYFDYYVTNSIIYAPRPVQSDYTDTYATINVSYTDTYGDMSAGTVGATVHGTGNVNLDPVFVNLTNRDFHLQATSPCVDAGDPAYALDPDTTRTDMGARTYDHGTPSVPTGYLTADTVWTAAGGPYRVFGAPDRAGRRHADHPARRLRVLREQLRSHRPGPAGGQRHRARPDPLHAQTGHDRLVRHPVPELDERQPAQLRPGRLRADRQRGRRSAGLETAHRPRHVRPHRPLPHPHDQLVARSCATPPSPTCSPRARRRPPTAAASRSSAAALPPAVRWSSTPTASALPRATTRSSTSPGRPGQAAITQILNSKFAGRRRRRPPPVRRRLRRGQHVAHFRKDSYNTSSNQADAISADGGGNTTVVRNTFYNVDHAAFIENGSFMNFVNNSVRRK